MPFDAAGFPEGEGDPQRRSRPGDNLITAIIVVIAAFLLATPISLASLVDIVRYVRGE